MSVDDQALLHWVIVILRVKMVPSRYGLQIVADAGRCGGQVAKKVLREGAVANHNESLCPPTCSVHEGYPRREDQARQDRLKEDRIPFACQDATHGVRLSSGEPLHP